MLYLYLLCVSVYCLIDMIDIFHIQVLLREKMCVHVCMYVFVCGCACLCVCVCACVRAREREGERERERGRERDRERGGGRERGRERERERYMSSCMIVDWRHFSWLSEYRFHVWLTVGCWLSFVFPSSAHVHELWNLYLPRKRQFLPCLFYYMDCWLLSWSLQAI